MHIWCHIRICSHSCKGNESKSTCSGCIGEPGHSPPPSSVGGGAGGGGGMADRVLPGDSEGGRVVLWQAKAAS